MGKREVTIYKGSKKLAVKSSVYKMLGINDINEFYAEKFAFDPPPNIVELDLTSRFDIGYLKQYWIYDRVTEGSRVLDIGCGSGTLNLLKSKDVYLVGTDLSEKALGQALEAGYDECVLCDGFDTPFPDRSFDFVVSLDVLGHIENEAKDCYLDEWVRLLKDAGTMLHGIECEDMDYSKLDEETATQLLIDGHVGLESFDKVRERFGKYFTEVTAENFMGPCCNWYDIKKYQNSEERIGKEFRDYLMTFTTEQARGFNAAMLLLRDLLAKDGLLGKSGGFMFIEARGKKTRKQQRWESLLRRLKAVFKQ